MEYAHPLRLCRVSFLGQHRSRRGPLPLRTLCPSGLNCIGQSRGWTPASAPHPPPYTRLTASRRSA